MIRSHKDGSRIKTVPKGRTVMIEFMRVNSITSAQNNASDNQPAQRCTASKVLCDLNRNIGYAVTTMEMRRETRMYEIVRTATSLTISLANCFVKKTVRRMNQNVEQIAEPL